MRLPAYPQHPQPHSFGHRWILGGTDLLCPALLDNRCPTRRWKQRQQRWWQQHQHQHQQRQQQQQRLLARRFRSRQLQLLALRHARALARTERVFCPCCRDSRCRRPELQRHRYHCAAADEGRSDRRERADSPLPFTASHPCSSAGMSNQLGPSGMCRVG